jgi:hypothetical protein
VVFPEPLSPVSQSTKPGFSVGAGIFIFSISSLSAAGCVRISRRRPPRSARQGDAAGERCQNTILGGNKQLFLGCNCRRILKGLNCLKMSNGKNCIHRIQKMSIRFGPPPSPEPDKDHLKSPTPTLRQG